MARLLFLLAHSTDDPDRAATALDAAAAAAEAGHEVALWLRNEGVRLGVEGVAAVLREAGVRPAEESLAVLAGLGATLHVSAPCFAKRKFDAGVLHPRARLAEPARLAGLVAEGWVPI